jgi:hypothetical protein
MTILYVDPVAGNDANNGLSFANRKRTFNSVTGVTSDLDTIRLIASPDAFSVGSASWTDNSKDITWTNTANLKIDGCESGWTAATNVTVTHPTGNKSKTGSSFVQLNVASGFTTGKAAYKTLPSPLTVSAFQQIAFYLLSQTTSNFSFKICLCSDTTGDTIVAEISKTMTYIVDFLNSDNFNTAHWLPMMLDYGSALPGTAINSVAIYFTADPGTAILGFDGFTLCKAPGASDLIDLYSLIGKNAGGETEWYPVADLAETGVKVTGNRYRLLNGFTMPDKPYRGTTESVTTYIRNPLKLASSWDNTDRRYVRNKITIEGGWNRTDMSTKTGETWMCGMTLFSGIRADSTNQSDVSLLNMGFTYCVVGATDLSVGQGKFQTAPVYDFLGFIACDTPVTYLPTGGGSGFQRYAGYFDFRCKQVWASLTALTTPNRPGKFTVGRIHGYARNETPYSAWIPGASFQVNPTTYAIGKIDNNTTGVLLDGDCSGLKLVGTVIENNTLNFNVTYPLSQRPLHLHFDNMADLLIDLDAEGTTLYYALDNYPTLVRQTRIGGDPNKNRTIVNGNEMFESSQDIRHTASGLAWRLYVPIWGWLHNDRPAGAPGHQLTLVACEADKEVTVTCWVYVEFNTFTQYDDPTDFPTATFGLMVLPDTTMELPLIQVPADMAVIGSWQQVTLTFTPGVDCVVPVYAYVHATYGSYGPAELTPPDVYSAYFDDVEVTQEA